MISNPDLYMLCDYASFCLVGHIGMRTVALIHIHLPQNYQVASWTMPHLAFS